MGYCSNTNSVRRFRCEDNNVSFMHVQPHYYRVQQVELCHGSCGVARHSPFAIELMALCLNNNNNDDSFTNCLLLNIRSWWTHGGFMSFYCCQKSTISRFPSSICETNRWNRHLGTVRASFYVRSNNSTIQRWKCVFRSTIMTAIKSTLKIWPITWKTVTQWC